MTLELRVARASDRLLARLACLLFLTVSFVACSSESPRERFVREGLELMEQLAQTLEGVSDKQSAMAAKPGLERLTRRLNELQEEDERRGPASPEEDRNIFKKYGRRTLDAIERVKEASTKLESNPEAWAVLEETLEASFD